MSHGWAPDPPMVGIRSPICLVVGSCTRHPDWSSELGGGEGMRHKVVVGESPGAGGNGEEAVG